MTERLLQYIWQFQYFNRKDLQLSTGESLQIIHQGQLNTHQGPDFLQATIKIGQTVWAGNIELHVQASDWFRHAHQHDKNYKTVILHVVWYQDDNSVNDQLPLLFLQDRVPKMLLRQYEEWMLNQFFIPCGDQMSTVEEIVKLAWKERLLIERLQQKSILIQTYLHQSNQHWEETFWWLLARNFGIKVNAGAFESIARSLPVNILVRHKSQVIQLEALLLGQAGLLNKSFEEKYPKMLQKEYRFYKTKYKLKAIHEPVFFLRMRPENFPTLRLAQLAALIRDSSHLLSKVFETENISDFKKMLDVTANDYWHYHYVFDESSQYKPKRLGEQMVNNIIINTIAPVVFAYGYINSKSDYKERAMRWLQNIAIENNNVIRRFRQLGITCKNAFDSQSMLELKFNYCDKRRCLDCAIGNSLLKRKAV